MHALPWHRAFKRQALRHVQYNKAHAAMYALMTLDLLVRRDLP